MTLRHYTLLLLTAATLSLQAQVRLVNDGPYARLTIDGQPMLVLGGELILLWFGAWKNSMSCYAPLWFKQDTKRFPRSMTRNGKPLEIASAFSEKVFQADQKAFNRLMAHLAATDTQERTVVMVQVENEIGMLEEARDHSPEAVTTWPCPSTVTFFWAATASVSSALAVTRIVSPDFASATAALSVV